METEIKRVNFFDGQFLKEGEFIDEQIYHQHMRRRLNFALYEKGGVIVVNTDDLQFANLDPVAKTFSVNAGMAIALLADTREGTEIVVREITDPKVDLSSFTDGDTAWITMHYLEEGVKDPPSEGDVSQDTRVTEKARFRAHTSKPLANEIDPEDNEPYVILGSIAFVAAAMQPNYDERDLARIRASLIGGAPGPPATLQSITVSPASPTLTVGATQTFTATGNFDVGPPAVLGPADGLAWSSNNAAVVSIDANTGQATAVTAGGPVTITAAVGAIEGTATVTVTSVVVPPSIDSLVPDTQGSSGRVDIRGQNLHDGSIAFNQPAVGTNVRLFKGAVEKIVDPVTVRNPGPFAGQVVRINIPNRDASWALNESVTLELTFGPGAPATATFTYDD